MRTPFRYFRALGLVLPLLACGLDFQGAETVVADASTESGARQDVSLPPAVDGAPDTEREASVPRYCDGHLGALLCEDFEQGLGQWSSPLPPELRLEQMIEPAASDAGGGGFALSAVAPEPNKKFIARSVSFANSFSRFSVSAWLRPHTSDNDPSTVSVIAAYFFTNDNVDAVPAFSISAQLYRDKQNVKVGGIWIAGNKADADPLMMVVPIDQWGLVRHDLSLDTQTVSAWFGAGNPASETDQNGERGISFNPSTIHRIEIHVGAISARNDPGSVNALANPIGSAWQYAVDNILVEGSL